MKDRWKVVVLHLRTEYCAQPELLFDLVGRVLRALGMTAGFMST